MTGDCGNKCCGVFRLAVALGLAHALGVYILGILGMVKGYGLAMISVMASVYPGYAPTIKGAWLGTLWGFLDTFFFVLIAGVIYCLLGCCCRKVCGKAGSCKADK